MKEIFECIYEFIGWSVAIVLFVALVGILLFSTFWVGDRAIKFYSDHCVSQNCGEQNRN